MHKKKKTKAYGMMRSCFSACGDTWYVGSTLKAKKNMPVFG